MAATNMATMLEQPNGTADCVAAVFGRHKRLAAVATPEIMACVDAMGISKAAVQASHPGKVRAYACIALATELVRLTEQRFRQSTSCADECGHDPGQRSERTKG